MMSSDAILEVRGLVKHFPVAGGVVRSVDGVTFSIRAGETLQADGEIAAGPGYGVFAGMNVQMDAWPDCAWVRALRKPSGLVSGFWEERPAFA